jgi:hypothetical protein
MEDLKAIRKRKFFKIRLTILLIILAVGSIVALYMWLVYVPYMLEHMDDYYYRSEPPDLEGDGTAGHPYLIKTAEDLAELSAKVHEGSSYRDVHFLLVNNIDLTEFLSEDGAGYNDGAGWLPIGSYTGAAFSGVFDGAGHTISGLWLNRPEESDTGLFGQIRNAGIYRLNIEATSIIGRTNVGALAGNARGSIISTCSAVVLHLATDCNIYSNAMGGLVGDLRSTLIENSSAVVIAEISQTQVTNFGGLTGIAVENSRIISSSAVVDVVITGGYLIVAGGLTGNVYGGSTITDSHTEGNLTVTSLNNSAGGLVGSIADSGSLISGSFSECFVSSTHIAGGLAGIVRDEARITNSRATGNISGAEFTGGFAGMFDEDSEITRSSASGNVICTNETEDDCESILGGFVGWSAGTISRSFATGDVETVSWRCGYSGGFVGAQAGGLITDCYTLGSVSYTYNGNGGFAGWQLEDGSLVNCYSTGYTFFYGFIAAHEGIIENSYFDSDTAEIVFWVGEETNDLFGRTTEEMQNRETFEGWDFVNIWFMPAEGGYPQLR